MEEGRGMVGTGRREAHALVDDLATERLVAIIRAGHAVDVDRLAEIFSAVGSVSSRSL